MNQESSELVTNSSKLASVNSMGSDPYYYFLLPPDEDPDDDPEAFPESLVDAVDLTYYKAKSIIA